MSNPAILANSQSISAQMQKGNSATMRRLIATRKNHSPKVNHPFSPDTLAFDQAGTDKSRRIVKAAI